MKEEEIEYDGISEQKPAAEKSDQIFNQMDLTQLEKAAEEYEAVINNNVAGVPVVSKRLITPFTTALKALKASQKAAVGNLVQSLHRPRKCLQLRQGQRGKGIRFKIKIIR